jgi:D-alanyl-D-alanine carboxypeptidase
LRSPTTAAAATTTTIAVQAPSPGALLAVVGRWRQQYDVPGAVAAVQVGTEPPVIVASGTDARTGAPLDPHVPFPVASITKTFVGALILQLVDDGELALDDRVATYVPGFPNAERITLRQLLTHTSGIPPEGDDAGPSPYSDVFEDLLVANLDKSFTPDEVLAFVRDRPLYFDPGTGVEYSNVNTILLAKVVEAVTGNDLTTAFHERLIGPLGLTHTYYGATETGETPASGVFTLVDGGPLVNTADFPSRGLLSLLGAAGGLISNVDDLLTWGTEYLRAGALGQVDLARSRFEVDAQGLGLGVVVFGAGVGGCVFSHGCTPETALIGVMGTGGLPGTNSVVAYFPEWDVTIVGIGNSSLSDVDHELLGLLLDEVVGHQVS